MSINTKESTIQEGEKMYRLIHLLLLFLDFSLALKCTQPLEMPDKSEDNRDTSGLRPNKLPPIAIGDTVTYQCPGIKSIKSKSSFTVKCNDLQQYVFPSDFSSWGECQCNGDLTGQWTQCPGLRYDIK